MITEVVTDSQTHDAAVTLGQAVNVQTELRRDPADSRDEHDQPQRPQPQVAQLVSCKAEGAQHARRRQ